MAGINRALLRNLLIPLLQPSARAISADTERIAFQISVILIGLPMFLLHWRWANRQTTGRLLPERFLYLYFMIGAFLVDKHRAKNAASQTNVATTGSFRERRLELVPAPTALGLIPDEPGHQARAERAETPK